jgi:DNA-binding NarL/FixJ family response regulator
MATKVVIVDDHEMILSALKQQVEALSDFSVLATFIEMNACLNWFESHDADILVTDIYIDSCYSLSAISKIRKVRPQLKVIIISGNFSKKISKSVSDLQVQGVWEKLQNLDTFSKLLVQVASLPQISFSRTAPSLLTPREEEICILLAQGNSVKSASKILSLSDKTIEAHKSNIMSKIGAKNQNELVKWAISQGLVIM